MVFRSREEMLAALGTSLRESRLALNISQQTAADRSGISLKAVRNIESGENASTYSLVSLCRTLGKTDWIVNLFPCRLALNRIGLAISRALSITDCRRCLPILCRTHLVLG